MACCLRKESPNIFPAGFLGVGEREGRAPARGARVTRIVEKPCKGNEPSDLVNIVVHYHPKPRALFDALKNAISDHDDLYERALQTLFDSGEVEYYAVTAAAGFWQPVKYPWHELDLMDYFLRNLTAQTAAQRKKKKVTIAATAAVGKNVYLDEGVRVLDNAVIQGPAY